MTRDLLEDRRTLLVVAALIAVLFGIANLPWQLDDYDQAKQAFTSFEMVKEGHWLYQHTPHERVATKPPLVGWTSAALFAATRSWEIAWRLPSLVAALALAFVLFLAAKSAYGKVAAVIAVSAFGLNLLSPRLATLVRTDMPLALVIFLIGLLIWKKIREGDEWKLRDQVCVFVLLTAAMLIKGPIVYAFLVPGIVLFQLRYGRVRPPGAPPHSPWLGWWPWLASLVIFLVWVIGGIRFQPGFYEEVVMREFLGRFGETIHRPQPLLFYFPHLLHKFAPWSLLIIAIAFFELRSRDWRLRELFRDMSPETFWLLCWSIGGLIVMSLIPSKRVDRIFPVIPPLCLLRPRSADREPPDRVVGRPQEWRVTTYQSVERYRSRLGNPLQRWLHRLEGDRWLSRSSRRARRFRKHIRHEAEVRHWRYEACLRKMKGCFFIFERRISLSRLLPSQNGMPEIWMRSLPRKKKRQF